MPFAALGGLVLHYCFATATGTRTPVVFINSLGTDLRIWDAVVDDLCALLYHLKLAEPCGTDDRP